jgi:hypothetical protein
MTPITIQLDPVSVAVGGVLCLAVQGLLLLGFAGFAVALRYRDRRAVSPKPPHLVE